jgi:hypothetical protein
MFPDTRWKVRGWKRKVNIKDCRCVVCSWWLEPNENPFYLGSNHNSWSLSKALSLLDYWLWYLKLTCLEQLLKEQIWERWHQGCLEGLGNSGLHHTDREQRQNSGQDHMLNLSADRRGDKWVRKCAHCPESSLCSLLSLLLLTAEGLISNHHSMRFSRDIHRIRTT